MAVRQSGETESEASIMASCESWALPGVCPAKYVVVVPPTGTVAAVHAVDDALGELLLSAVLMPLVSPNRFWTLAFFNALSVVCHCCLSEKWVTLFSMVLSWLSAVVAWETRLA